MSDEADDDTVPTGRSGVDPLIAYPTESTGMTGQIERPGDGTPWWFIPTMFAIALGFIALLAYISESRSGNDSVVSEAAADSAVTDTSQDDAARSDGTDPAVGASTPDSDDSARTGSGVTDATEPTSAAPTTVDPLIADLPDPGVVRLGAAEFDIVSVCEVHHPYEPVDTDTEVSSYFFFAAGERGLVERVVNEDGDRAIRRVGEIVTSSPDVTVIGDAGAFSAAFVGGDVVVNPTESSESGCADRVVTNAPGQLAEPHIQIVLDVCVADDGPAGTTIAGLISEGGRFEIPQAGGELAEIVFERGPDDLLRTSAPATILRTDEQVSASGVVSNGVDDLDITIDIDRSIVDDARACTDADRL
ncbi:hypothetical protein [Ilumatobacter sp.]|uniref:hypothetical protein n=1 Tax=Ilumatobacter sp. TaxID=1967498 RepID=UPI003C4FC3E2